MRVKPIDVYYSVAYFRNPTKVGIRGKDSSQFFKMDLVFDIDEKENLKLAFQETRKIYQFGRDQEWVLKYCAFSGSKGFHLVYQDPFTYDYGESIEDQAEEKRRELVERMENFHFDHPVTVDTRRIIRVPYTINSKTGLPCTIIDEPSLRQKPFEQVMADIHGVDIRLGKFARLRSLLRGNDRQNKFCLRSKKNLFPRYRLRLRSGEHFYSASVSNRVVGTKMFVPILRYHSYLHAISDLQRISKVYNLGLFHLFRMGSAFFGLGLKPLQKDRLLKVLRNSKSSNLRSFEKRGVNYMEIGPRQFSNKLESLVYLGSQGKSQKTKVSLGHLSLFRKYFDTRIPPNLFVGENRVELIYYSAKVEFL